MGSQYLCNASRPQVAPRGNLCGCAKSSSTCLNQMLPYRWADIAKELSGRTENAVKNHWNATLRRRDSDQASFKLGGSLLCVCSLDSGASILQNPAPPCLAAAYTLRHKEF